MPIWLLSILSGTRKLFLNGWEWIEKDPWRLFVIVAAVLALLWLRADARADRLALEIKALRDASEMIREADKAADRKAAEVAAQTKSEVEDGNQRARDAARGSDDPIKSGFDSLRSETAGGRGKAAP